jgi:hypothetical protein
MPHLMPHLEGNTGPSECGNTIIAMRERASVFLIVAAVVALQLLLPIASLATDGGDPEERTTQAGEDRWVPSLTLTSGVTIQTQTGSVESFLFEDTTPPPVALRDSLEGSDLAVSPFVGGSLELMSPALPIPTRPRLFLSGEVLPTFATSRNLVQEGEPDCVSGPELNAPCAAVEIADAEENGVARVNPFGEDEANGQGQLVTAEIQRPVWSASVGIAFPVEFRKRQLRIKPSFGWINYEVEAEGLVIDAMCREYTNVLGDLMTQCTDILPSIIFEEDGILRETTLSANDSQRFNGIGPGLDVEMDTGRFGPIGSSVFLGARAYHILGDRSVSFGTSETYDDEFGMDTAVGIFEVEVDPWIVRASVGIRFQWLGSRE